MRITIFLKKGLEGSAAHYFDRSKKAKKKLEGLEQARKETLAKIAKRETIVEKKEAEVKEKREPEWFEKFRWFYSSEGFLCIGGRDATTNDIVVKKHTLEGDIVFHTEIAGSPFFVVKAQGKEIGDVTKEEVAIATASFSRGWRLGLSNAEVYYVSPQQLSKEAPSGEFVGKGAFMVRGKRNQMAADLALAIGVTKDGLVMCGPQTAVKKHCGKLVRITPGREKTSDAAKKIRKELGAAIDDIVRVLPAGGLDVKKN